ncbi:MAG: aromatic ring-hydroxylating dioxygenase subunit alpha [Rhodospirillaceae bacterium]|nr:aromatic ring-hydroxylating dioxygenase subunit alpha [Rhodospirillaceae bacterium]
MFINNWYVAAGVDDLKNGEPMFMRMLGCDFVLFRDSKGETHCLSDVCCHRGASLSKGKLKDDCVICPYHGWEFNMQGVCTKIPALGADVKPPKRARIDSYPVREKFGWIWVFLGDAPEEERPPFLDDSWFPEYYDEATWRKVRVQYHAPVNWARSEENSIDGAHPSFVHASFGSKRDPKVHIVPVVTHEWGASTTRERTPPDRTQKSGAMREITAEKRGKTKATTAFCFTGVTHRIEILRADGLRQVTLSHRTPVDEFNTRTFTTQCRDYLMNEEFDRERLEGRQKAIAEDIAIVSTVRPPLPPKSTTAELLTEADQLETAFRAMNRRMEAKGWEIDSDEVEREVRRQILVIPSPKRLTDPKNWVHKTVPTTRPRGYLTSQSDATEAAE